MVASKMVASKTKSCNNLKANNLLALKKKKKTTFLFTKWWINPKSTFLYMLPHVNLGLKSLNHLGYH